MQNETRYLYVGCGSHRMEGFTHVEVNIGKQFNRSDISPPEILADITRHIPLPNDSVDLVFSRATMEHLTYPELLNHFLECYRILKKGGLVRMVVPDMDKYIRHYLDNDEDLEYALGPELGNTHNPDFPYETHTDLFVHRMLYFDHRYLHNFETLSRALNKCGFSDYVDAKPGES